MATLDPGSVKVDGRSLEEILDFVYNYARQVNYFDKNLRKEDWLAFFQNSVPFQAAQITLFDLEAMSSEYQSLSAAFSQQPALETFNPILDFLFDLIAQINFWVDKIKDDTSGLIDFINHLIGSDLNAVLHQLIAFSNAAAQWGYRTKYSFLFFRNHWELAPRNMALLDRQLIDKSVGLARRQQRGKQKLDELYAILEEAIRQIVEEAGLRISDSIQNNPAHQPHLGLFFAFLRLFEHARNDLNKMTGRHLDFFYKEVLQLKERTAAPDSAHLLFELIKPVEKHPIGKGALFTAGDDDSGVGMFFELERDIVVDKARVDSLRTLFLDQAPAENASGEAAYAVKGIYMAPQANSADGLGEAFKDENMPSWETVGEKESKFIIEDSVIPAESPNFKRYPFANLGIVLGARALFLQEGNRRITLKFSCDKTFLNTILDDFSLFEEAMKTQYALTDNSRAALEENGHELPLINGLLGLWKNGPEEFTDRVVNRHTHLNPAQKELLLKYADRRAAFKIAATGEEEWFELKEFDSYLEAGRNDNEFRMVFQLALDASQPAVLPFNAETLGAALPLNIDTPAIRLEFNHDFIPFGRIGDDGISLYHYLRFLKVLKVELEVEVKNARNFILQNEDGLISPDAPFFPFGVNPQVGESFYIGSREIFQKDLTALNFHIEWDGLPEDAILNRYLGYRKLRFVKEDGATALNLEEKILELGNRQPSAGDFEFEVALLKNGAWSPFTSPSRFKLFDAVGDIPLKHRNIGSSTGEFALNPAVLKGVNLPEEFTELDVNSQAGFMRLALKPNDLLHDEFNLALERQLEAQGAYAVYRQLIDQGFTNATKPEATAPNAVFLDRDYLLVLLVKVLESLAEQLEKLRENFRASQNDLALAANEFTGGDYLILVDSISNIDDNLDQLVENLPDTLENIKASSPDGSLEVNIENALGEIQIPLAKMLELFERDGAGKGLLHPINVGLTACNALLQELEERVMICLAPLKEHLSAFLNFPTGGSNTNIFYFIPTPKDPVTPEITSLSIDYTAVAKDEQVSFFHLHPFDGTFQQQQLGRQENQPELVPKFIDEGTLFIGLKDLRPGGTLNLLFQMAESTSDPFMEQAEVDWYFLSENKWQRLEDKFNVLEDETMGLIRPGVINFSIPTTINKNNTILPPDWYWIKAGVRERAGAVSETISVHAQAARARFVDRGNDLTRLSGPLEKGSIANPVQNIGAVKSVQQPYDSFGGRPEEKGLAFYTRVSERLRHKGRAVTLFDFERLVLENYPEIYKAKCITHTLSRRAGADQDNHLAPGYVTIAVIPDLSKIRFANRFEPRATAALLEEIEKFLKQKSSPFVRLRVINPDYQGVNFRANIGFVEGVDQQFFQEELRNDLRKYLAPWAFDPLAVIAFDGRIFRSTVLKFVEERPYVDFVTDFTMFGEDKVNVAEISAVSARSILVPGKIRFEAIECCTPKGSAGAAPSGC